VIVEDDDLYGDGVNIAARIDALADAGAMNRTISIAGTSLDLVERSQGRPLLFLHPV
jgi:adenylate cyclase